jgi:DNA-binding protein Fis
MNNIKKNKLNQSNNFDNIKESMKKILKNYYENINFSNEYNEIYSIINEDGIDYDKDIKPMLDKVNIFLISYYKTNQGNWNGPYKNAEEIKKVIKRLFTGESDKDDDTIISDILKATYHQKGIKKDMMKILRSNLGTMYFFNKFQDFYNSNSRT